MNVKTLASALNAGDRFNFAGAVHTVTNVTIKSALVVVATSTKEFTFPVLVEVNVVA